MSQLATNCVKRGTCVSLTLLINHSHNVAKYMCLVFAILIFALLDAP